MIVPGGHAAAALLHVERRIGTAVRFTRRRHKEARLRKLKQFGDIFTDAVALLAARKQRDGSGSAVAPLAFMTAQSEMAAAAGQVAKSQTERQSCNELLSDALRWLSGELGRTD